MWLTNLFKRSIKVKEQEDQVKNSVGKIQRVVRVYSHDDLNILPACFSFWSSDYYDDPSIYKKIHEHLMSAQEIKVYVSSYGIEYSAWTKEKGQVNGSCHTHNYNFFTFGIRKAGVRYDLAYWDKSNPDIKAFWEWLDSIFKPIILEFQKDYNL